MEELKDKTAMQKTQIFNVIILDRSGSMQRIRQAAVDGFNETLVGIKKAQEKFADTQEHFVSLVTFCSCETCNVFDKVPVGKAHPLSMNDYEPCCSTPLYDAMGFTLTAMHKQIKDIEDVALLLLSLLTVMRMRPKNIMVVASRHLWKHFAKKAGHSLTWEQIKIQWKLLCRCLSAMLVILIIVQKEHVLPCAKTPRPV